MQNTTAVALLVKTPGHSPVKTRLAEQIGSRDAEIFHRLSANATAESLRLCVSRFPDRLTPYWAVAEDSALGEWEGFPAVSQGEGTFGERMARVYSQLRQRHTSVVLAATDSPEITSGIWLSAWRRLAAPGSVIGPAADGGFYLVGSNLELPESVFSELPLSTPQAAESLAASLEDLGGCGWLPLLEDIDLGKDLDALAARLETTDSSNRELSRLAAWARDRKGAAAKREDGHAPDLLR